MLPKTSHNKIIKIRSNNRTICSDGRKSGPINHGPTTKDTLLEDAAKVCKEYMARDPGEIGFSMVALGPADTNETNHQ